MTGFFFFHHHLLLLLLLPLLLFDVTVPSGPGPNHSRGF